MECQVHTQLHKVHIKMYDVALYRHKYMLVDKMEDFFGFFHTCHH